jgi:hypothetical protein
VTTFVRAQVRKEFRQLLPWWGAVVGAMAAIGVVDAWTQGSRFLVLPSQFSLIGVLAYAAGAVMLGAMVMGHEYAHQTLPALLLQPVTRSRVWLVKFAVLTTLLTLLAAIAVPMFGLDSGGYRALVMVWVPLTCGLCLAPWLTMLCRGTLAGAVLSAALTFALFPTGSSIGLPHTAVMQVVAALAVLSAFMTWWTFTRLEAAGGPQAAIDLLAPVRLATRDSEIPATVRTRRPIWLLVWKELRLQQPTFAVSGLFVLTWLLATGAKAGTSGPLPDETLYTAATLHLFLVPLFAGGLASAEERRFGTADWHLLLPFAVWIQWAVKAGVALTSTVALTVGVPVLMMTLAPDAGLQRAGTPPPADMALLCLAALFVSSLSANGVHALLATPLVIGGTLMVAVVMIWPMAPVAIGELQGVATLLQPTVKMDRSLHGWWMTDGALWMRAGMGLVLAYFGFANHTTSERSRRTLAWQFGWIVGYALAALLVLALVSALFAASVPTRG